QRQMVPLRDLAIAANADPSEWPASVANAQVPVSEISRVISTLRSRSEGIDPAQYLRTAQGLYETLYSDPWFGLKTEAPPFDEYLMKQFPATLSIVEALSRGEQPPFDAVRVLGEEAGVDVKAEDIQDPPARPSIASLWWNRIREAILRYLGVGFRDEDIQLPPLGDVDGAADHLIGLYGSASNVLDEISSWDVADVEDVEQFYGVDIQDLLQKIVERGL